jgi:hypothetical protein
MLKALTRWLSDRRAARLEADRKAARNALRRRRYAAMKAERLKAAFQAENPPAPILVRVPDGYPHAPDSATHTRPVPAPLELVAVSCRYGDVGCALCVPPPAYTVQEMALCSECWRVPDTEGHAPACSKTRPSEAFR